MRALVSVAAALMVAGCADPRAEADAAVDRIGQQCSMAGFPYYTTEWKQCVWDLGMIEMERDRVRSTMMLNNLRARQPIYARCQQVLGQVTCTSR